MMNRIGTQQKEANCVTFHVCCRSILSSNPISWKENTAKKRHLNQGCLPFLKGAQVHAHWAPRYGWPFCPLSWPSWLACKLVFWSSCKEHPWLPWPCNPARIQGRPRISSLREKAPRPCPFRLERCVSCSADWDWPLCFAGCWFYANACQCPHLWPRLEFRPNYADLWRPITATKDSRWLGLKSGFRNNWMDLLRKWVLPARCSLRLCLWKKVIMKFPQFCHFHLLKKEDWRENSISVLSSHSFRLCGSNLATDFIMSGPGLKTSMFPIWQTKIVFVLFYKNS